MEFKEVVNKRHSVRNFKSDEIPVTVLEDIGRTVSVHRHGRTASTSNEAHRIVV